MRELTEYETMMAQRLGDFIAEAATNVATSKGELDPARYVDFASEFVLETLPNTNPALFRNLIAALAVTGGPIPGQAGGSAVPSVVKQARAEVSTRLADI